MVTIYKARAGLRLVYCCLSCGYTLLDDIRNKRALRHGSFFKLVCIEDNRGNYQLVGKAYFPGYVTNPLVYIIILMIQDNANVKVGISCSVSTRT